MSRQRIPAVARARRRALVVRAGLIGALLVVLLGVALLAPRAERGSLTVASVSGSVEPTGVLQGNLVARRHGDTACYSVTVRGTTSVLRFEAGWSADDDLSLVDSSGSVVAEPGSRVTVLGAPAGVGTVAGCSERGRIWTITSVRLRASS